MPEGETLLDDLRRRTRSFTRSLPEDEVFGLGCDLARELCRAHAESPPRHPRLEADAIPLVDGKPSLGGSRPDGDAAEDLFLLGALLNALASGSRAQVSWRLDGPPPFAASSIARRYVLEALGSSDPATRFHTAEAALGALEGASRASPHLDSVWGLHRGDLARKAYREAKAPAARLEGAWEALLGATVASPVLAGGLVVAPTSDGRLLFVDRGSGRRLHELPLASAVECSPALADQLVVVGTDDGEIVAVDLVAGSPRYRTRLGQMIRSSPLSVGSRVVIGVIEARGAGSLVCLEASTGKPAWKRKLGPVFSSPALGAGRILVGSDDGSLHAFDAETGTPGWSARLGGKVRATPALTDELALVGDFGGRVSAVRLADGSIAWARELGQAVYSSAAVGAGLCVVGCHDGWLRGLELATGEVRFETRTGGPVVASPVMVGDRIFVGSTDGDAYLLDCAGVILERRPTAPRGGIQSSAAVDLDLLVFGSSRGLHAMVLRP
jgi:outer membrane protein assembly factor BamB